MGKLYQFKVPIKWYVDEIIKEVGWLTDDFSDDECKHIVYTNLAKELGISNSSYRVFGFNITINPLHHIEISKTKIGSKLLNELSRLVDITYDMLSYRYSCIEYECVVFTLNPEQSCLIVTRGVPDGVYSE